MPVTPAGTQVIRCTGCGAALQVSVRPMEGGRPPESVGSVGSVGSEGPDALRPRRKPMVEVSGPRRAEVRPLATFTVELSQSDIDTEGLDSPSPAPPAPPAIAPMAPPAAPPPAPVNLDTPWVAEDIERLPEANASLGQLALETFEALPPLKLRPDTPATPRTPPGGVPPPPSSRGK